MSHDSGDEHGEGSLVHSFVIVAALSAAARVFRYVENRRRGIDPSEQQEAFAAYEGALEGCRELREILMPLRLSNLILSDIGDARERTTRGIDLLQRTAEAAEVAHTIHQQLLSLYPAIPEDMVEHARTIRTVLVAVSDPSDDLLSGAAPAVAGALRFSLDLEALLSRLRAA